MASRAFVIGFINHIYNDNCLCGGICKIRLKNEQEWNDMVDQAKKEYLIEQGDFIIQHYPRNAESLLGAMYRRFGGAK